MHDRWQVVRTLIRMSLRRTYARVHRSVAKLFSPKRILATTAAVLFLSLYLLNGVLVILTRTPVEPALLTQWLSGSMAVYGLFHFIRASWQEPEPRLGLNDAESLWLVRAPLKNRTIVFYRLASLIPSTMLKTLLLAIVLYCDVTSPVRLVWGLLCAMLLLESIRIIADRVMASISETGLFAMRVAFSAIAISLVGQLIARTVAAASGSVHPLTLVMSFTKASGDMASSSTIQWLAMPWWTMIEFATATAFDETTAAAGLMSLAVMAFSVVAVVLVDHWGSVHSTWVEGNRRNLMLRGVIPNHHVHSGATVGRYRLLVWLPRFRGIGPLISRQWVAVRRYRATIFFSLALPAALSLAPLMTSSEAGLLHVAAWLAVCTLLLAPPALRIDFRRDLDRMWLLKSLPISPVVMTVGQILLPSLITVAFQLIVVAIACVISPSHWATVAIVTGGLSGLAVVSFALENTLFLTFPHRPKQEGLAMMVRTKLVFLGKGLILSVIGVTFIAWVTLCTKAGWPIAVLISGCVFASWLSAAISVMATARCWRRFTPVSL